MRPLLFALSLTLAAQAPTFQTSTQLVIETVSVKDKDGRPVTGLTAKDFTITEDGVPQSIKFFEFQQVNEALPAQPANPQIELLPRLTKTQIAAETPGDIRYRDRRLLALYFDMTAMPQPDQLRAFNAAESFVRNQMTGADLVAIMAFTSGSVQVLLDFTADRNR